MDLVPPRLTILMAEDDPDDRILAADAAAAGALPGELRFVHDGEELLEYLRGSGRFQDADVPAPGLILLDLNMPRKDGRETLREIKSDPSLRRIPVVVLTTSGACEDINTSYDLGANSYITKPASFQALVDVMRGLGRYWLELARLPGSPYLN